MVNRLENDVSDEDYTYEDEEVYEDDMKEMEDFDVSFTLIVPQQVSSELSDSHKTDVERILCMPNNKLCNETGDLEEMVWIRDPKSAYKLCKVKERSGDNITVSYTDDNGQHAEKIVKTCETQQRSQSHYCEDMCNLTELNEASVLHTIRTRYDLKLIHTYSGLFCVVVNPWRDVPLYTPAVVEYYMTESKVDKNLPPHIYAIAQSAYNGIMQGALFAKRETNSQSILITGESGAGKTENTKKIIEYLLCCATNSTKSLYDTDGVGTLDSAILNAGTTLEAFSNAKTVHNNNSSRLGRFIRLDFDSHAKLSSARIDCYLLEKSRVVSQNEGNRNFHIFYQIFTDELCSEKQRQSLGLFKNAGSYRFLNQGDCVHIRDVDDRKNSLITSKALDELNFREVEKNWILECIAACILTGEIRFNERQGLDMSYVENLKDVDCAASLIGLNASRLVDALTQPTIRIGDNVIRKNQNLKKTLLSASAFVKVIYERLFSWIVDKCNEAIESRNPKSIIGSVTDNFIGVLDIAGFEIMDQNSFEQFCINYTNEKLQQFFNQVLFVKERNDYVNEGIEWNESDYGNGLQPTIDLIERPMGLLSLLQEECIVPNGKDSSLLGKFVQNLSGAVGGVFSKSKCSSRSKYVNHFTLLHYAGTVSYNIDGWVEKNRDLIDQAILEVLSKSTHTLIGQLFPTIPKVESMSRSQRGSFATSTISCVYKEQLSDLLQTLNSSQAHFVRCIVPNYERLPFVLDGALVMNQLKCNGVLEGIRVYRRGFPNRIPFGEFLSRYNILYPTQLASNAATAVYAMSLAVENMCKCLGFDGDRYRIGKTKIFCRTGLVSELEGRRKDKITVMIVRLQAQIRWNFAQAEYRRKLSELDAVRTLQNAVHRHVSFIGWPWYRMWLQVRELIPLARDRQRLAELEVENVNLTKENKRLKVSVDDVGWRLSTTEERMEKLLEERDNATQRAMKLRNELTRNEELMELMERKFEDQHNKIMRLNGSLNDNVKTLERMDAEKRLLEKEHKLSVKRHADESAARSAIESALKDARKESMCLQTRMDAMFTEFKDLSQTLQLRDAELSEWDEKFDRKTKEIAELNRTVADANEKVIKTESLLTEEKNLRRKYENEMDDLENKIKRLRNELDKGTVKYEALKEQLHVRDNTIRKLEHKLDDKCVEMESCVNELKKMHKTSQIETHNQLDELKRKCVKLEMENKQQKMIIESSAASSANVITVSSTFDRESSAESDYGRSSSTLGRYYSSRHHMFGGSSTSIHGSCSGGYGISSGSSIRALSARRRDTEPELGFNSRHYDMTMSSYGSLGRSLSHSSSRLSRNATLSNLTSDSGIARSSSTSSNAPTTTNFQLQNSERKVAQLERDLHNTRTDGHLMKREVEVYKDSLQEAEKEKEHLRKQIHGLAAEIDQLNRSLKSEEDRNQQLTFEARKASNEREAIKKQFETAVKESQNELAAERKRCTEKLEEQKHGYELKFHHIANSQNNFEKLQSDLAEAQSQLDKALGQIVQMERLKKSQDVIGTTLETQYRGAVQEIESLRDENAALKSKIRRQYKQIELLTQQFEMNEYVNDLASKVDRFNNQVERSASVIEIPVRITDQAYNSSTDQS